MVRRLCRTLPVLCALGLGGPALGQQGSAYIDQINGSSNRGQSSRTAEEVALGVLNASGNGNVALNTAPGEFNSGAALLIPGPRTTIPAAGQVNNLAVLNQFGSSNTGAIEQSGGTGNSAIATILGNRNTTTQTQVGNDSSSVLTVVGNGNALTAGQTGDRNSYTLNVGGSSNSISHQQTGNDLSFGLTVLGRGANISITQTPSAAGSNVVVNPAQATILPTRR